MIKLRTDEGFNNTGKPFTSGLVGRKTSEKKNNEGKNDSIFFLFGYKRKNQENKIGRKMFKKMDRFFFSLFFTIKNQKNTRGTSRLLFVSARSRHPLFESDRAKAWSRSSTPSSREP